jgi:hypothetical protein
MIHYGVHFHAPRAVRAAEKLGSDFAPVRLQPTDLFGGEGRDPFPRWVPAFAGMTEFSWCRHWSAVDQGIV